jgi:hypothetical protein
VKPKIHGYFGWRYPTTLVKGRPIRYAALPRLTGYREICE